MDLQSRIAQSGFAVVDPAMAENEIDRLSAALSAPGAHARDRKSGGTRDVLRQVMLCRELARTPIVADLVGRVLGDGGFAVRGTLFEKSPESNWKVPWHQDLTIAVRRRTHAPGYGPWSTKAGVAHVQPPVEVLENMLSVRVHLDECGPDNGPVRVLAGSHRAGRLTGEELSDDVARLEPVTCLVRRGGFLVMRPLLVHASSAATVPCRRRILHLDFAAGELAPGVEWFERWSCAA